MPLRNPNFTGRDSDLGNLARDLAARSPVMVHSLHGMGGVGKTQLATEYAHTHMRDYDLVWWVPAEEPAAIPDQFTALPAKLDLDPDDDPAALQAQVHDRLRTCTGAGTLPAAGTPPSPPCGTLAWSGSAARTPQRSSCSVCAPIWPEPIPLDLFTGHPDLLPEPLSATAADPIAFADTVTVLTDYSLAKRTPTGLQLHRLIQATMRARNDSPLPAGGTPQRQP